MAGLVTPPLLGLLGFVWWAGHLHLDNMGGLIVFPVFFVYAFLCVVYAVTYFSMQARSNRLGTSSFLVMCQSMAITAGIAIACGLGYWMTRHPYNEPRPSAYPPVTLPSAPKPIDVPIVGARDGAKLCSFRHVFLSGTAPAGTGLSFTVKGTRFVWNLTASPRDGSWATFPGYELDRLRQLSPYNGDLSGVDSPGNRAYVVEVRSSRTGELLKSISFSIRPPVLSTAPCTVDFGRFRADIPADLWIRPAQTSNRTGYSFGESGSFQPLGQILVSQGGRAEADSITQSSRTGPARELEVPVFDFVIWYSRGYRDIQERREMHGLLAGRNGLFFMVDDVGDVTDYSGFIAGKLGRIFASIRTE